MKKSFVSLNIILNTLFIASYTFASEQDQINKVMAQCKQRLSSKICRALQTHNKENYNDSDINSIKTVMKSFCQDLSSTDKNYITKCFQSSQNK